MRICRVTYLQISLRLAGSIHYAHPVIIRQATEGTEDDDGVLTDMRAEATGHLQIQRLLIGG